MDAKGKLVPSLRLWWHPPQVEQASTRQTDPRALPPPQAALVDAPEIVECRLPLSPLQSLRVPEIKGGLYRHVRLVLDAKDYYFAGEYMG